ncbi:indole-3-glycerol phosphate synthase-domain-containing protein [Jimgerdemannia flammicorona]|uniref:Multifunctional tryptophan biosynthesis protein n=1 Tax=Jimgerdemannia flammicorona TaxID=994334 RepID=A0A433B934_9FUNG|nr:indole-3-glycerol phosphate synthase-domain-containing protein [Jimgerdemannia flammicorona]
MVVDKPSIVSLFPTLLSANLWKLGNFAHCLVFLSREAIRKWEVRCFEDLPPFYCLYISRLHTSSVHKTPKMTTVLIDNYDSFTWNIYQYLSALGAKVEVYRNDQTTIEHIESRNPRNIVVSPGPGHPSSDAGISREVISYFAGKIPILGICLGEQCIFEVFGGTVSYAGEILHGKTSAVKHDGKGLFRGVPQNVNVTRYHSLAGVPDTVPEEIEITGWTENNIVMAVRHREFTVEGVQFHPESILCEHGKTMLANFLEMRGGKWDENLQFGVPLVRSADDDSAAKTPGVPAAAAAAAHQGPKHIKAVPSILAKIHEQRLLDIQQAKSIPGQTPDDLRKLLSLHLAPPLIDFVSRIRQCAPSLFAEIKRASPSKGNIDLSANAAEQALRYAHAGAAVVSVLTEPKWFKGSLTDMRNVREVLSNLPNRPAILRKDFIVDTYQIMEARLHGADTVLLIVAMLTDAQLKELYNFSRSLGMEPLVEVNNGGEMKRALAIGARVVGVNNRNLHNFDVDMETTSRLVEMVPAGTTLVALSGITERADVVKYVEQGVAGVLVGESLMKARDARAKVRELLGLDEKKVESNGIPTDAHTRRTTLVKICGIQTPEAAVEAAQAGADFIGIIFAKSRRQVPLDRAAQIVEAIRALNPVPAHPAGLAPALPSDWFAIHRALVENAPRRPLVVGVFQNQPLADIARIAAATGLDFIQLHGTESPDLCRFLPLPAIKAHHIESESFSPSQIPIITQPGYNAFVLLDAKVALLPDDRQGGQGVRFDWSIAKQVVDSEPPAGGGRGDGGEKRGFPVILAGGLDPENVAEAIRQVGPWAVDVSSGVETDGVKDLGKIREFVRRAKEVVVQG